LKKHPLSGLVVGLIMGLILRHFEAIRAYQAAIRRASPELRQGLAGLMADHEVQARELVLRLIEAGGRPPTAKEVTGEAAGEIEGLRSQSDILSRLLAVEEQVAAACAEALKQLPPEGPAAEVVRRFLAEEPGRLARLREALGL
jgi:hypothetical protein